MESPFVVSNAVPEEVVIDGFNSIRISSFNPEDYANTVEKLLKDEDMLLKLSSNSSEFIKRYNHNERAKKYIKIIRELL